MDHYEYRIPHVPKVTRILMIACAIVFLVQQLGQFGQRFSFFLMLWPVGTPEFGPWQLLTYAFLHYDIGHLFFNLLGLFMFGSQIEQLLGPRRYLQLMVVGAVVAGITHMVLSPIAAVIHSLFFKADAYQGVAPLLGISGAVFALLMAQAMMYPRQIVLFFMVMPMENRMAVAIFGAIELLLGLSRDGVAHFAHLGGMLGAWLIITWWRRGGGSGRGGRKPPLRRVH